MKTPICDFVKEYSASPKVRAHMPGHKGIGDIEHYDITEIAGADSLYEAQGIIAQSEQNAGALFGADTFFSTEGSSLAIRAMLYLAVMYAKSKGQKPLILAARGVHRSFVSAAALIDFEVKWFYPKNQESYLSCKIDLEELERQIKEQRPTAVYITSPDYLGNIQDIKGISRVCKKNDALLLVDNAHGAYLKFLKDSVHPMDLGADMCADSAHKTLPVLTGGAYLHVSKAAPDFFKENAKTAMSLFGSTSPSYVILQSLDRANVYLETHKRRLAGFLPRLNALKGNLTDLGYTLEGDEPLKITVRTKPYGYTGDEFARILVQHDVMYEFCDPDYVVLMLTQENSGDMEKILTAFEKIKKRAPIKLAPPRLSKPEKATGIRQAVMGGAQIVPVEKSLGRIAAAVTVGCPPAVPITVSGEVISQSAIECFKYYSIEKILVKK